MTYNRVSTVFMSLCLIGVFLVAVPVVLELLGWYDVHKYGIIIYVGFSIVWIALAIVVITLVLARVKSVLKSIPYEEVWNSNIFAKW